MSNSKWQYSDSGSSGLGIIEYNPIIGTPPSWINEVDFVWVYDCLAWYPATENGWISADHDPPTEGKYLVLNEEYNWGAKYWDNDMWISCWNVQMWKPVLTPEKPEEPERYVVSGYENDGSYMVIDKENKFPITNIMPESMANTIADALNGRGGCQCS